MGWMVGSKSEKQRTHKGNLPKGLDAGAEGSKSQIQISAGQPDFDRRGPKTPRPSLLSENLNLDLVSAWSKAHHV